MFGLMFPSLNPLVSRRGKPKTGAYKIFQQSWPLLRHSYSPLTRRTAFYQMAHDRWRTQVFIPLNTTNEGNYQQITMEKISQQGIPICREGHDMYFSGYCKDLDRVKWRCPIKATKAGKSLGCECLCSRSTYGRVVYTHPKDNLRLYPKTPRNSLTWKAYYNHLYLCPARFQTPKTGFQAHTVQDEIERPPSLLCAALGYGCPC